MKRILIVAALFLGFSVVGFSQTAEAFVVGSKGKTLIQTDYGQVIEKEWVQYHDEGKSTSEYAEIFYENPNVTVNPGELIIIHNDGTDKRIVFKSNGEHFGFITSGIKGFKLPTK